MEDRKITCFDIFGKKTIVSVNKLSFRPSVYGVIIHKNKILLTKQWGKYDFPGGGIEPGEKIEEALKREVFEETGLRVKVGKIVSCENSFFKIPFEKKYIQATLIYYVCSITGGKISVDGFDEYEKKCGDFPKWFYLKDINKIKFISNAVNRRDILKKAIKIYEQ